MVEILVEWKEAWEFALPYVRSIRFQESVEVFMNILVFISELCPEFKDAFLSSDVEALMILPQLFAVFCANDTKEAAETMKVACDLSLEAAGLPCPTDISGDLYYDLASGEFLREYCDCGMRLQRANPLVWNNFSHLISVELREKLM